jgi:ABC-2 type transport system ATP-binding protein
VRDLAISVSELSKVYGDRQAVDQASFEVPVGSICGFVGPNGSGKTTTMRMLLGLIKPTHGSGSVLGEDIKHPEKYLSQVGAMIEGPAFYPALSGAENLRVLASIGGFSQNRVSTLLEQVGLGDRGDSKYKTYSLGMKQRLGIAAALLPQPKLLVLDEPTNGLDPSGIQEIRNLIKDMAKSGTSIFVSSHLLSELEMISDHLVMLREGKVIFTGRTDDLLAAQNPLLVVKPEFAVDLNKLVKIATKHGKKVNVADGSITIFGAVDWAPSFNRLAFEAGITLSGLSVIQPSLEETFFEMTGE